MGAHVRAPSSARRRSTLEVWWAGGRVVGEWVSGWVARPCCAHPAPPARRRLLADGGVLQTPCCGCCRAQALARPACLPTPSLGPPSLPPLCVQRGVCSVGGPPQLALLVHHDRGGEAAPVMGRCRRCCCCCCCCCCCVGGEVPVLQLLSGALPVCEESGMEAQTINLLPALRCAACTLGRQRWRGRAGADGRGCGSARGTWPPVPAPPLQPLPRLACCRLGFRRARRTCARSTCGTDGVSPLLSRAGFGLGCRTPSLPPPPPRSPPSGRLACSPCRHPASPPASPPAQP